MKLPFDRNERDFLKFLSLIQDGEHVLDIGANIGVMTYYFAKRLPQTGVHSFEPIPDNLKVLERLKNKFHLLNVKIHPFALGNKNDMVTMVMPEYKSVYLHGLSHVGELSNSEKGLTYQVDVKRLDDIDEFENFIINAVKIDVEEYEYQVLMGAEELIKRNKPLIYCELWEGENRVKSIEFIRKLNYKVFINQGNSLIEFSGQRGYQNFFFIPEVRSNDLNL